MKHEIQERICDVCGVCVSDMFHQRGSYRWTSLIWGASRLKQMDVCDIHGIYTKDAEGNEVELRKPNGKPFPKTTPQPELAIPEKPKKKGLRHLFDGFFGF